MRLQRKDLIVLLVTLLIYTNPALSQHSGEFEKKNISCVSHMKIKKKDKFYQFVLPSKWQMVTWS